jgi:hypothetical protein
MIHRQRRVQLLLTAVLSLLAVTGAAHAVTPHVVSVAAARQLPLGTEVTVVGISSTPSGVFESSFFDKGFGLQDKTAGIFISQQDVHPALLVFPGARVVVTGVLKDSSGLLVIAPAARSAVSFHGRGPKVTPLWVTTGAISEATEGRIVLVVGRITQPVLNDLPYGYKFSVDDGSGEVVIFINTQTGIDVSGLALDDLVRVVGFSSQFETHYEIDPRGPADITQPAL